ncbi:MAG: hypothetical protein Q7R52_02860 [archaeon]|nr:hypothetical protein [archaeon]
MAFDMTTVWGALVGGGVRLGQGVLQHVIRGKRDWSWKEVGKSVGTSVVTGAALGFAAPGASLATSTLGGYVGSRALDKAFLKGDCCKNKKE